jgi:hypothetical protein
VRTVIRIVLFVVGLAVLIRLVSAVGVGEIFGLIGRTRWHFLAILLVYGGSQLARAAALWLCQPQAAMLPYRAVLAIRVSAEAVRLLTFTGPLLSEPSKVWLLGRRGLDATAGIATITAELLAHSLVATTLSIGAFLYLIAAFDLAPLARIAALALLGALIAYVVGATTAIGLRVYLIGAVAGFLRRRGLRRFVGRAEDVRAMEDLLLLVLRERPTRLALILMSDVAANLCLVLEIFVTLTAMAMVAPVHYSAVIEGCVKFVSIVFFFIPTQVGVSEGTYAALFETLGLTAAGGVSLAFIRRLRTLTVAGIGLVIITVLSSRTRDPGTVAHERPTSFP